jgi:hypothetical protein
VEDTGEHMHMHALLRLKGDIAEREGEEIEIAERGWEGEEIKRQQSREGR